MFDKLNEAYTQSSLKPLVDALKGLGYFLFVKGKRVTWIFGVTLIMVGFPLVLSVKSFF